jgi:hypothetical protein
MFVWGKSQADLYCDSIFDKGKLRIMGYPHKVETCEVMKNENVVCILGENIETTNKSLGLKKKNCYEEIADLLTINNYKVVYKPHPFEKDKMFIPANIEIVSISLKDAFDKYSKFVALTSTALLEATLHGKIAIQYYDECFGGEDFSIKGYSYAAKEMNELPSLFSTMTVPSTIDPEAVLLSKNPSRQFLDTVDSLPDAGVVEC